MVLSRKRIHLYKVIDINLMLGETGDPAGENAPTALRSIFIP